MDLKISNYQLVKYLKRDKYLILLSLPMFLYYLIFSYIPMSGVVIAFQNFTIKNGLFNSQWVGFEWFQQFFSSMFFPRLIRNTILISFFSLLFGTPVSIIFALMLNELRNGLFKRFVQSVSYFPYFISTVVVVGILINFLNPVDGIINTLIKSTGKPAVEFMTDPAWFRFVYIASGIWQGFGWGAVLYIGAISSIDPQLYEAARIDGAGRYGQLWHITLPGIRPVFITLMLLSMGNILNVGFEKIILMYSPSTYETADVISSYVYRSGIADARYSYATAVGLFNSVVNTAFILISNWVSKRTMGVYLW